LRSLPTDSGTALGIADNGRHAREVAITCKRERVHRPHTVPPAGLAELAKTDPSVLVVNADDTARRSPRRWGEGLLAALGTGGFDQRHGPRIGIGAGVLGELRFWLR